MESSTSSWTGEPWERLSKSKKSGLNEVQTLSPLPTPNLCYQELCADCVLCAAAAGAARLLHLACRSPSAPLRDRRKCGKRACVLCVCCVCAEYPDDSVLQYEDLLQGWRKYGVSELKKRLIDIVTSTSSGGKSLMPGFCVCADCVLTVSGRVQKHTHRANGLTA